MQTVLTHPRARSLAVVLLLLLLAACQSSDTTTPAAEPTPPPTEAAATAPPAATATESTPLELNSALPIEERVEDLLGRMTLAEKIGQMTLVEKNSITPEAAKEFAIGAVLSGGGGAPRVNSPEAWLEMVTTFDDASRATRLGIPILYGVDAVHGHNNVKGAVIFPHNIGLGATGDPDLVERIGRATAQEVSATGIRWNYAPAVSVPQDIRWGRTYEGYSEDTALVTALSSAYLRGLQGESLDNETSVLATLKHFVGDGGTVWGTSRTADYEIDQGDTVVDDATLRRVHLPPYIAGIEAGAQSVMVSYSSLNGEKMHGREDLIQGVLKEELGFDGFVVSDWEAIDQISSNYYEAVVQAINAGIDMNMVPSRYELFIDALTAAVDNGDVTEARIDDAVRRILRVKFALGLFDRPVGTAAGPETVGAAEHRALAREAVAKSLVLLRNENDALPIPPDAGRIFVAGEAADDIGYQSGGWTIEWQGKPGNITPGTTLLEGIEAAAGADSEVHYNRFGKFDRITDDAGQPAIADVGIVVLAERPYAEGAGDAADLTLSETEINLIVRMRERSDRLVLILLSGRPLIITDQLALTDAVVAAWLPGTEGQGVADVLFGDFPFTGRLPYHWPRTMGQLPFDPDAAPTDGCTAPLFPLGYGLAVGDRMPDQPACPDAAEVDS